MNKKPKATEEKQTPEEMRAEKIRTSAQRETVEAFVVAFVLALLFRAFIAEAFVIPTGSMAPTLMGAHKDITCQQCSHPFQIGASKERRGPVQTDSVIAGICPNCRFTNSLDLAGESNHATFNGDRILVSKFAYTINDPDRWDVIVFKFPGNPKQNYIKRLVGLPNEELSVQNGDIFVAPLGEDGKASEETILRKPADTLLAMSHHVYDSDQQSEQLIKSEYPSRLQPWRKDATQPPTDSWKVDRSVDGMTAKLTSSSSNEAEWLRYFHHWPSPADWQTAADGGSLREVDPYASRLVTDFYGYDCYVTMSSRRIYEKAPSNAKMASSVPFNPSYESGGPMSQYRGRERYGERGYSDEGMHWVGDLIAETSVDLASDCKQLKLEIVEAGVQYQCDIDLSDGKATLRIIDGDTSHSFVEAGDVGSTQVTGKTGLTAGESASIRFSNCDDQLLLWIDDALVEFDGPTTFDARKFRSGANDFPRYQVDGHPLDASPFGLAVVGGTATVNRFHLKRDKYYCSTNDSMLGIHDYEMGKLFALAGQNVSLRNIQALMATPEAWNQSPVWQSRRKVTFRMEEDQFFPMGDNSPESLDARCWAGTKNTRRLPGRYHDDAYKFADASYVPRNLLVGRALMVFWPHPWNTPVPLTPNFKRFRLIR